MIRSVTIVNHIGEELFIELADPEKSGFAVQQIVGLGPAKAHINTGGNTTGDGTFYNSARVQERNIVFDLIFVNDTEIESVRQKSYKYFPIKKKIKIKIETDNRKCETYGYIESNEPNIFSERSGTVVSVICPDPYFYSVKSDIVIFSGIEPMFEFPFSNEKVFSIGVIRSDTLREFIYSGDTDIGMIIRIGIYSDDVTNIRVYNVDTRKSLFIDTSKLNEMLDSPLDRGDVIIVDSNRGAKTVTLLRDGIETNILNSLSKDSDWLTISRGKNTIAYEAETGVMNLKFELEMKVIYEGV